VEHHLLDVSSDGAPLEAAFNKAFADNPPECVALPGWSSKVSLAVLRWCYDRRIPAILMSETNSWDFERKVFKEALKSRIIRHFSSALVTSDSQASYLESLGLSPKAIFRGYNAVDNDFFCGRAEEAASQAMPEIGGFILPEDARGKYFLASSRFVEKKNLIRLIRGYAEFRRERSEASAEWPLVLIGDGELRPQLERELSQLRLTKHVHMPGFVQIGELPRFYGTAGGFVHASTTEQWGLVVNEAMASGLPVAVSRRCGCAEVLVTDGHTGILFDPESVAEIARSLHRLTDRGAAKAMSSAARERISLWGPDRFGEGMRDAVEFALRHGSPPTSWTDGAALTFATQLIR
jgi:1,2-diacylglycerol 3-alpha-glucosyltransferase